jgi:uncharacterized hydrophobic protein (TIGR00271 family)
VLRLRVSVEPDRAADVLGALGEEPGITDVVRHQAALVATGEDLITAWVRESAVDEVLAALRVVGVVRRGNVTLAREHVIVPGPMPWSIPRLDPGAQVVVWEEVEGQAGRLSRLTPRYLALMGLAGLIAAVGILETSTVPIVGAMAVSPDLLPLVSIAYGLATRRLRIASLGLVTLAAGLAIGIAFAALTAGAAHALDLAPGRPASAFLVGFVSDPSLLGALVALGAGVAGMISFQAQQGAAAVGVAISITTIPAAAAVGVNAVDGAWAGMWGALAVLGANLSCVVAAGAATVLLQRRLESRHHGR